MGPLDKTDRNYILSKMNSNQLICFAKLDLYNIITIIIIIIHHYDMLQDDDNDDDDDEERIAPTCGAAA